MFFKKHKRYPEECTQSERKCLNEFLNRLNYFTCPGCDNKIYSVEKHCKCSQCGEDMLIAPLPTKVVKDGGTRIINNEPQKDKPKPPRSQYGTNFIPPINTPPPEEPGNQYGDINVKPIKEILFIDSKLSIRAREYTDVTGTLKFIKEIKPFYDNNGSPCLYNLIGDDGNVVASIQSNSVLIKY